MAFWKSQIFGFTQYGEFITIDPNDGPAWWGAAVTTSAPVLF